MWYRSWGQVTRARTQVGSALERHIAGGEAPAVRETARELTAASVSANTRRAYEGALRRLRDWLAGRPLDDATLAEYLAARFEAGHSPAAAGWVPARRTGTGPGAGGGRPLGAGGRRGRGGRK